MRLNILARSLLVCAVAVGADAAELTFYLPFDGTPTAAVAKGAAEPLAAKGLAYADGVAGQAVRLTAGAKATLSYALAGNVSPTRGAVSLWVKREADDPGPWRRLFSFPEPCRNFGSGALSLWWYEGVARVDLTDVAHTWNTYGATPRADGHWEHLVFCWDVPAAKAELYYNGVKRSRRADGTGPMAVALKVARSQKASEKDAPAAEAAAKTFDRFFIGCLGRHQQAEGLIDEVRVYDGRLTADEVRALFAEHADRAAPPRAAMDYAAHFGLARPNPYEKDVGDLDLELVKEYAFDAATIEKARAEKRFRAVGALRFGELGGVPYLEAGTNRDDRFAFDFTLDSSQPLYVLDFDYPDDATRTCDLLVQERVAHPSDYTLQVGYFTGDEYRNTGKTLTHRCLYWTRKGGDRLSVVALTARAGVPAALSRLRVSRVRDARLPALAVREPPAVDGWRRVVGQYWEDPAIAYDFGLPDAHGLDNIGALIDRTIAYMKFCGENLFCYPGVWYQGVIDDDYQPRRHAPDFLSAWYEKFDRAGLFFVPNVNPNNLPVKDGLVTVQSMSDGSLHPTPIAIHSTGKPNWGGWHNSPPNFCFLHPDVQRAIEGFVDGLVDQGAAHPSFKGVCLHLTMHCLLWWGDLRSGYNDYVIDAFERDTGVRVPRIDGPLRGKAHAEWILANCRDRWVQWRCDQVTRLYRRLAAKLRARRPDLKLWLNSFIQPDMRWPDFMEEGFMRRQAREAGLAREAFADVPNVIFCQTTLPAFCRKRERRLFPSDAAYAYNRVLQTKAGFFDLLKGATFPLVQNFDLYWENPVGRGKSALNQDGFVETGWRVTTLNPSGFHALRDLVLPLRFGDVLGVTKGGYLIGTYGMEGPLRSFAAAFRQLPAVVMTDVPDFADETVKIRACTFRGRRYLYAVNTSDVPRTVRYAFPDGTTALTLAPYELRSFAPAE